MDNKYILATDTLIDHDLYFTIVETVDDSVAYLGSQISCDFPRQIRIALPEKIFMSSPVLSPNHTLIPPNSLYSC